MVAFTTKMSNKFTQSTVKLGKTLSLVALFLTVGAPLVTLISMVASYKDHLEDITKQVILITKEVDQLQGNTYSHNSDIEVFKQNIIDNSRDIFALKTAQDNYGEKILEVWKETARNDAQIESLKTEVLWLKSNEERSKH